MIDAIVRIIDRLIDLGKRRELTNRNLFNDFVVPAFNDFEAIHKEYLESLYSYIETLKTYENFGKLKEDIIRQINQDILFSESLRSKVFELERWEDDPQIGNFIKRIIQYIRFDCELPNLDTKKIITPFHGSYLNRIRSTAIYKLKRNFSNSSIKVDKKIENGIRIILDVVTDICRNYSLVIYEYNNLKDKLLR